VLQHARQGRYTHALASLLEPDVWRGLTMNNYTIWAHQIWHILVLRASRRCVHSGLALHSNSQAIVSFILIGVSIGWYASFWNLANHQGRTTSATIGPDRQVAKNH